MTVRTRLSGAVLALGFLSTTAQVIILRELLVVFTGNELTVATTLAFWLLSVACGCLLFTRAIKLNDPPSVGLLLIIAGFVALFQVILIRLIHPAVAGFGELLSFRMMAALSFAGVAPCAAILGGLFVGLVGLAGRSGEETPVAKIYGSEAIGSAAAGVVLSLYLLATANSIAAVAVSAILSLIFGSLLRAAPAEPRASSGKVDRGTTRCHADGSRKRFLKGTTGRLSWLVILSMLAFVLVLSDRIDRATRQIQWGPFHVVESLESKYGSIVVTARDGTFDFFESGALAYSIPDPMFAEESAHIPLSCHPRPERVLVLGGAGSGIIPEITKHPSVRVIRFVELDPVLVQLTGRYAPADWLDAGEAVVTPLFGDGRRYVATAGDSYDVIILNVGTPVSLQTNRYYTLEFFRQVNRILRPDGVFSLKIPCGGAYIGPDLASLLWSLAGACRQVFAHVVVLPGDYVHILASQDGGLKARTDMIAENMTDRGISASYINPDRLWERLLPMKRAYLDSLIAAYSTGSLNTDDRPVSASHAIAQWAKQFAGGRILSSLVARTGPGSAAAFLVVTSFLVCLILMPAAGFPASMIPGTLAVYCTGLTTMFTQILIVLSFQIVSGYMYGMLAALVASFMFGMGLASSLVGSRAIGRNPVHLVALAPWLAVLPLATAMVFNYVRGAAGVQPQTSELAFTGLALVTGALGGTVFAAGSSSMTGLRAEIREVGAISYSVDLWGATLAGFATGLIIVPSLGITVSAYVVTAVDLILLVPLLIGRLAYQRHLPR